MFTHTLVHYAEIALKGENRPDFEKKLIRNIATACGDWNIDRLYGRILIEATNEDITTNLKNVFGINDFSPCIAVKSELRDMQEAALELAKHVSEKREIKTFCIRTKRSNKAYPLPSMKVNEAVGNVVNEKFGWAVDLENPDLTIYIEIADQAYLYVEKLKGPGGLPVGITGTVVCLLSGGIDSPVAAWYAMKRGCNVVYVHFHTYTSKIEDKLEEIVKILAKYQPYSKLYMVPFFNTQEDIIKNVPGSLRMILYKKMMFRIAEEIMHKENALAFVTGDNLAQVASQTLENMNVIYADAKFPILSPLVGFDKKEIVTMAEKIGTYEASIKPYKDCCSFLVVNPSTKAKKDVVDNYQSKLDVDKLVADALSRVEIKEFRP